MYFNLLLYMFLFKVNMEESTNDNKKNEALSEIYK